MERPLRPVVADRALSAALSVVFKEEIRIPGRGVKGRARSAEDGGQRIRVDTDGQTCRLSDPCVKAAQQGCAAGEQDALTQEIRAEFRRRVFQRGQNIVQNRGYDRRSA